MKKRIRVFSILVFIIFGFSLIAERGINEQLFTEKKVDDILEKMSLKEKISLLSGKGFEVPGIERLKIPPLKMSDGPAGVRWGRATAFPAPVALAATWDPELVEKVGKAMAEELKAYGRNVFLAPCVNIHRIPIGSRNFESYGEDPILAGEIAKGFIKGVQKNGVIACVKHFAANNQEWNRRKIDVIVSERALREIYFPAFKKAVKEAGVWSVMAAYNRVNGYYCSENGHLLTDVLKNEWRFKGFVMSDWGATHSTVKSAKAGLDLEMPYGKFFSDKLLKAVKDGKVSEKLINDKVRRILRAMIEMKFIGKTFKRKNRDEIKKVVLNHKKLTKRVSEESMVLLRNKDNTLPLNPEKIKSIAIIGPNAAYPRTGGGGSAYVRPYYSVSPIKGIKSFLNKRNKKVKIYYSPGVNIKGDILPVEEKYLSYNGKSGLLGEYFLEENPTGKPAMKRIDREIYFNWSYDLPELELGSGNDSNVFSVIWSGFLKPPVSGEYNLKILSDGGVKLSIDNKLVLDDWKEPAKNYEVTLKQVKLFLKRGKNYRIKIEYSSSRSISEFKFGWDIPGFSYLKEAIKISEKSDYVIAFLGLSPHFETESRDRDSMEIPNQNKLIKEVLKVNKNIIVVLINGSPININEWADKVEAIVEAWYPGQEEGNAISSVIFGERNPSGKLPFSWYKRREDCFGFKGYKDKSMKAIYYDDIFVGYRYLDKKHIEPLFPFGFGLSYTKFEYSKLKVLNNSKDYFTLKFRLKNTGNFAGAEIIQIYVSPPFDSKIKRPLKELKAFKKINLLPHSQKIVRIRIKKEDLSYFCESEKRWKFEKGVYKVLVGASSRDIKLSGKIKL